MKEKVKSEYFCSMRKIWKLQLISINKIMAINSLAAPVMTCSFGILPWLKSEIEKLDCKARKILTMNGMHPPGTGCTSKEKMEVEVRKSCNTFINRVY